MQTTPQMRPVRRLKRFQIPILMVLALAAIAFLLKLPYLPTGLIAALTTILLAAGYGYLRLRYALSAPPLAMVLLAGAVAVDAIGNYLHLYGHRFGPVMYDEFSHCAASGLTMPVIIWLLKEMLDRRGHSLSHGLLTLFAITCSFSAAAFYEVIELWDELYFGGQRIWGQYDTPRDLQWDLVGILIGALLAALTVRLRPKPDGSQLLADKKMNSKAP